MCITITIYSTCHRLKHCVDGLHNNRQQNNNNNNTMDRHAHLDGSGQGSVSGKSHRESGKYKVELF